MSASNLIPPLVEIVDRRGSVAGGVELELACGHTKWSEGDGPAAHARCKECPRVPRASAAELRARDAKAARDRRARRVRAEDQHPVFRDDPMEPPC